MRERGLPGYQTRLYQTPVQDSGDDGLSDLGRQIESYKCVASRLTCGVLLTLVTRPRLSLSPVLVSSITVISSEELNRVQHTIRVMTVDYDGRGDLRDQPRACQLS